MAAAKIRAHHAKPYRKRHLSALTISLALFVFSLLQLGILQGINQPSPQLESNSATQLSLTHISSKQGYAFDVDTNRFSVTPEQTPDSSMAVVHARSRAAERLDASAQLTIQISSAVIQQSNKNFTVRTVSTNPDTIGGAPATKMVYEYTPTFAGGKSYGVVWSGVIHGQPFTVSMQGLIGSPAVPASFEPILNSLRISSEQQVKGASISLLPQAVSADPAKINTRYLSDAVSPAVVKIYHLVCGSLTVEGQTLTDDACTGFTGSGFLVTSDGYVATNGHVVVYGAQDALVDILTKDSSALAAFLRGLGLNADQIQKLNNDPITLASIIAKIYDIPDTQLNFVNKKDVTLVAVGSTPPRFDQLSTSTDISRYQRDTRELKVARIIGYNYAAKDKLTAIADPAKGFSASDVALLKIDVSHAPTIALSKVTVVQNQKVFLIGFPGDADNELTDNSQLGVSVTDGVISSIRQAAGKNGLLYQSDADASHGNSGGPAIDETGRAIGLLTYRASGDANGNAAKSYIRDINDFSDLTNKLHIAINNSSDTQRSWQTGLELYSKNHYSAALKNFKAVKDAYPAQRLADSYIASSQSAIDAGKDTKQLPIGLLLAGVVISFSITAASVWLIVRHHGHHQLYKWLQRDADAPHPVH